MNRLVEVYQFGNVTAQEVESVEKLKCSSKSKLGVAKYRCWRVNVKAEPLTRI